MEISRIPLMLLPLSSAQTLGARLKGLGVRILSFYPSVQYDLRNLGFEPPPENYCAIASVSAAIWGLLGALVAFAGSIRNEAMPLPLRLLLPLFAFLVASLFFLALHLIYPRLIAKSNAQKIDRELIFAMRDMLIQISSGVPLYTVIENVGNSDYEYVAKEFKQVATKVRAGSSLTDELESMAIRTQSEYLKKTCWQLVTATRAGADLTSTIKSIVHVLVDYQFSLSKSFNAELNFIILVFLMTSAVLPTIGTTVLVIFSVFGLLGITPEVFAGLIFLSFVSQAAIIGYVKMKRPNLFI